MKTRNSLVQTAPRHRRTLTKKTNGGEISQKDRSLARLLKSAETTPSTQKSRFEELPANASQKTLRASWPAQRWRALAAIMKNGAASSWAASKLKAIEKLTWRGNKAKRTCERRRVAGGGI